MDGKCELTTRYRGFSDWSWKSHLRGVRIDSPGITAAAQGRNRSRPAPLVTPVQTGVQSDKPETFGDMPYLPHGFPACAGMTMALIGAVVSVNGAPEKVKAGR